MHIYIKHLFIIESSVVMFWDMTPCGFVEITNVSEERMLSALASKSKPSKQQEPYAAGTRLCMLRLDFYPED
jgi:hypothetical protein